LLHSAHATVHLQRRFELGDAVFIRALQDFYRKNKFHFASFQDLRKSLENVSKKNLGDMFAQWVTRRGAPELKIRNVHAKAGNDTYVLTAAVEQVQKEQPYHFLLPVAITMEGKEQVYQTTVVIDRRRFEMKLVLPLRPVRIDFDPEFDIFRKLDHNEIPPAITQVLGAKKLIVILPSAAEPSVLEAYRNFAETLRNAGPDRVEIKRDREIPALPSDSAVCILGRETSFVQKVVNTLLPYGVRLKEKSIYIATTDIPFEDHTIVLTGRNPENPDAALLFVTSDSPQALKGLSRKLPHYHKYSYLAFRGDEPENIAKGRWPVTDSPMTFILMGSDESFSKIDMGRLNKREPLAAVP
jgi:aminopeptidase N